MIRISSSIKYRKALCDELIEPEMMIKKKIFFCALIFCAFIFFVQRIIRLEIRQNTFRMPPKGIPVEKKAPENYTDAQLKKYACRFHPVGMMPNLGTSTRPIIDHWR